MSKIEDAEIDVHQLWGVKAAAAAKEQQREEGEKLEAGCESRMEREDTAGGDDEVGGGARRGGSQNQWMSRRIR